MAFCGLPILLGLLGFLLAGCGAQRDVNPVGTSEANSQDVFGVNREELLPYAIDNLNRTEEFSSEAAIEQTLQRLKTLDASKPEDIKDTLLLAWPEPEMLRQVVDRLNQWIRAQAPPADWKSDPMLAALPKPLADLPLVKNLDQSELGRFDGYALQEAVLMRNTALWARGGATGPGLGTSQSLFDWTVRNIQIEPITADWMPQFSWETLLFGRGTAEDRAVGVDSAGATTGNRRRGAGESPRLPRVSHKARRSVNYPVRKRKKARSRRRKRSLGRRTRRRPVPRVVPPPSRARESRRSRTCRRRLPGCGASVY